MKQLLKDTTALGAIATFIVALDAWSRGSSAVPHSIVDAAAVVRHRISGWIENMSTLDVCALIYITWVAASFYAVLIEHFSARPRHILTSTLMFGSFGTTVLAMSVIVWAGLRA